MNFEGKNAIVTGCGKGIGKAVCHILARNGANVILCDVNRDAALETEGEIRAFGVKTRVFVCDVRDEEKIRQMAGESIEEFGKIDILINNAGIWSEKINKETTFADSESPTWDFIIGVNLIGTMNCTHAVIKHMIGNRSGKIVNVGSVTGVYGKRMMVDYSAAKGGVIAFTKALAKEVGQYNINVNCVSPGNINSSGVNEVSMSYAFLGRAGSYEECANVICFLASEEASYVSGQNYQVDGCRKAM